MFWFNLTLGCLAGVMAHNLTGGDWGEATRRQLEAGMRVLPLMALLVLPILFGLPKIYEWANPEHVAHSVILQQKIGFLNPTFFIIRIGIYFLIWITITISCTNGLENSTATRIYPSCVVWKTLVVQG
jgi:hypothetical protein